MGGGDSPGIVGTLTRRARTPSLLSCAPWKSPSNVSYFKCEYLLDKAVIWMVNMCKCSMKMPSRNWTKKNRWISTHFITKCKSIHEVCKISKQDGYLEKPYPVTSHISTLMIGAQLCREPRCLVLGGGRWPSGRPQLPLVLPEAPSSRINTHS